MRVAQDLHRLADMTWIARFDDEGLRAGVTLELLRSPLGNDDTVVNHGDPVGELVGLLQVLGGQQHCCSLATQFAHDRPELLAATRVESSCWFVEEQHFGAAYKARGQIDTASHSP